MEITRELVRAGSTAHMETIRELVQVGSIARMEIIRELVQAANTAHMETTRVPVQTSLLTVTTARTRRIWERTRGLAFVWGTVSRYKLQYFKSLC